MHEKYAELYIVLQKIATKESVELIDHRDALHEESLEFLQDFLLAKTVPQQNEVVQKRIATMKIDVNKLHMLRQQAVNALQKIEHTITEVKE